MKDSTKIFLILLVYIFQFIYCNWAIRKLQDQIIQINKFEKTTNETIANMLETLQILVKR